MKKKKGTTEWKVPKNTPVSNPRAAEQTDPPRRAMQGPICDGLPSCSQPSKQGKYGEEREEEEGPGERRKLYP